MDGCAVAKMPPSSLVYVWKIASAACWWRCWVGLKQVYANSFANVANKFLMHLLKLGVKCENLSGGSANIEV